MSIDILKKVKYFTSWNGGMYSQLPENWAVALEMPKEEICELRKQVFASDFLHLMQNAEISILKNCT